MCFGDHGINQSDYESTLQLLSSEEKYFPKLLDFLERDYPLKGSSQTLDAWREGNGYPLQYSCLENAMNRGAWQATVHGVSKSQTQLSD